MGVEHIDKSTSIRDIPNCEEEIQDKVKTKPGELPVKEYAARSSLLSELHEIKHTRAVYHLFLSILVCLCLDTVTHDYFLNGRSKLGFSLIIKGFCHLHILLLLWIWMFLSSLFIYAGFKYWAEIKVQLAPKSPNIKLWNNLCLAVLIMYYPYLLYFSSTSVSKYELSIAEGIAIIMESVRFVMKMHAFVRSNAPRVLNYKPHTESQKLYPTLSEFLYFSFAPTAIYKDSYPRSTHIRWNYVMQCFSAFFGSIYFLSILLERFYIATFENYGTEPFTWQDALARVTGNAAAGFLILMTIFYMVLHSWHNAFAEMLKFSDRTFYKDWWTSSDYVRYFRTWNVVVHDWLFTYIYKDFNQFVLPKNTFFAKIMVFLISAIFHDFILAFAFRFYIPIVFIQFFGIGVPMSILKTKNEIIGNVFLWVSLALGMSVISTIYAIEYFARVNCPIENETWSSYFVPRLFSCNK